MSDAPKTSNVKRGARLLARLAVVLLGLVLLLAVALRIYLATPYPADQLSQLLTAQLQQDFTVKSLATSGTTLILNGVSLKNPEGFPEGDLVAADSVTIAPYWGNLLRGKQRFRLVALRGIRINLDKNAAGVWNFSHLQQLLAARPKPAVPVETYIRELSVKDGSLKVQGQGVQGISLQVFHLATLGSAHSRVDLAFEDAARNRYLLKGTARPGRDAALDLTLTAPSLSLKDVATLLKLKNPSLLEGGRGGLNVNATLHQGELAARGDFFFSDIRIPAAGKEPLKGALVFGAQYSTASDTVRLNRATLTLENLVKLRAQGSVRGLKQNREFSLQLGMDQVDLALLNSLLPEQSRKQLRFGGKLSCDSLTLAGDGRKGVRSAVGTLKLKEGALARKGELIATGLSATVGVSRQDAAIVAKGEATVSGAQDKALLKALELPFGLTLSPKLKLVRARVPAFSASITGIPVTGRLAFDAAAANPITASLNFPGVKLAAVNPLLKRYDLHATTGTASGTLQIAGKSAQDLDATAEVQLQDLRGSRGKDPLALKNGKVETQVQRRKGRLLAQGDLQLADLNWNGKIADLRSGYRFADGTLHLDDTRLAVAGARISIARSSALIPAKQSPGKVTRYPLSVDLDGVAVKQREMELTNLSGRLRGSFNSDPAGRWLEGTADLSSKAVNWQGKAVAAPVLHASFARSGAKAELSGEVLGGKLSGSSSFNLFAPEAGATFEIGVSGAKLAAVAPLIPKETALRPSEGVLDVRINGGYSRSGGLSCRFDAKGGGIALTGSGARTLLSGASLSLGGALAGGKLTIAEAVLSPGQGVALKLKGELARALSPKREGSLVFSLPEAGLNNLIDPFVNILPRLIQEATVDGTVAAEGKIELQGGSKTVRGGVSFKGGRLEVESQKFLVADINGRFPFSLEFPGGGGAKPDNSMDFSRENYPRLLEQMRKSPGGGQVITVGKIGFGALELGKLTLHVNAANGITEVTSLTTSLYEGAILGRGFFTIRKQPNYRGDLLINGVSMRALCRTLPIQGYISGRVDGVISLNGAGSGLKNLTGFSELWAREGGGEKMVVSKEFLQRLAKQKLSGFFFTANRPYDQAEIKAMLEQGDLTFHTLKIVNTNLFGVRDLSVSIAPGQNRIAMDHLLDSIKQAAVRGKQGAEGAGDQPAQAPITQEFKWGE